MNHILGTSTKEEEDLAHYVFAPIARGDAILFLGAGSSVGEKQFLSQQLMQCYADRIGTKLETSDIVEFVDMLSADPSFDRSDFDGFVVDALSKLTVTESHKTLARLNWREIITTNCDLVIERAYDNLLMEGHSTRKLITIRHLDDYNYQPAGDEVKYVKINGCIMDPQKYPLVFSTQDFVEANRFYKRVLLSLENLSPKIALISIGYSFSDLFAKMLLKKFDSYHFRNKKWIINIDPYAQESQLPYFSENRMCIVKQTTDQFIEKYLEWEKTSFEARQDRNPIRFTGRDNRTISVPLDVKARMGSAFIQLSHVSRIVSVDQESFYRGEEPTFDTIRRNHDVIRENVLSPVITNLKRLLCEKTEIIPIIALKGSYGTGKTTFAYRLVDRLLNETDLSVLAFEVFEPQKLVVSDLGKLAQLSNSRQIVLLFNHIELDSNFKELVDLRIRISMEQFADLNILLIGSIRENILERYKHQHHYANLVELGIDSTLKESEAADLVEKLRDVGLVQYRDSRQKQEYIHKIASEYAGDTFTSLVGILSNSQHINFLLSAYNQLPKKAQDAFLQTSLLYRFGCLMPASLLRKLISTDWEEFKRDVLEVDCKGILIQQIDSSTGTAPDLYFRTKHPIISDLLVKHFLSNNDKRFEAYLQLVRHLSAGFHNATILVDLLKSIRDTSDLSQQKIDMLYDACSQEFGEDPHYTLHYCINLQHREDEDSILDAIFRIIYVEGFLKRRNHRLIHRRAALNFDLAKLTFAKEKELDVTLKYVREARELFQIKLSLDPSSSFGYVDFIRFEAWCLDRIQLDDRDRAMQMIAIEEMIEQAEQCVYDDLESIVRVKSEYLRHHSRISPEDQKRYLNYLDSIYAKDNLRQLALVLRYHFYRDKRDEEECRLIVLELENYKHLDIVASLLFNHYGRTLFIANNRSNLLKLVRQNSKMVERNPISYHFYLYVAAAYNRHFEESFQHVGDLKSLMSSYNPNRRETWRDAETGVPVEFKGVIARINGRYRIRIIELQQTFGFQLGHDVSIALEDGLSVSVYLHFYQSGIRAEIIGSKH